MPTTPAEDRVACEQAKHLRLAVPCESPAEREDALAARCADHFGRCPRFVLVDLDGAEVVALASVENGGHRHAGCMAPVLVLGEHQVDVVLVRTIGARPLMGCELANIHVLAVPALTVADALEAYRTGSAHRAGPAEVCRQ
jgi:predicted Fe-Mo cluster-binding NifX family protein